MLLSYLNQNQLQNDHEILYHRQLYIKIYDYKQILNTEFETEGAAKVITFQYGGKVVSKESKFVVVK